MNDKRHSGSVEALVDRALRHRAAPQPRSGLEQRVLAHVHSAAASTAAWRWKLAAAALTATLLGTAVVYLTLERRSPQIDIAQVEPKPAVPAEPAPPPSTPVGSTAPQASAPLAEELSAKLDAISTVLRQPQSEAPVTEVVQAPEERPPTFPAQRELSQQELLLVRFLRTVPRETARSAIQDRPVRPLHVERVSTSPIRIEPL